MQVNVIGCGKMGKVYVKNLVERLGFAPQDIFVYDALNEKALALAGLHKVNAVKNIAGLPAVPSIIASTTPSHINIIRQLLQKGVTEVFCEKPLCVKSSEAEEIIGTDAKIYVAFLMRFSQAVNHITKTMTDEHLHLSEAATQWGLNFYHNPRPLIGTLIDESVHGIDVIKMLTEVNQKIDKISVSAMITYPEYADPLVQKKAQAIDGSIPDKPDASVFANVKFIGPDGIIPVSAWSSYIMAQQTRRVSGVLSDSENKLVYAFEINFDRDDKTTDRLVITNYETAEVSEKVFPCNGKIAEETNAFLDAILGKDPDRRLTNIQQALQSVSLTEAMQKSHANGSNWVEAKS